MADIFDDITPTVGNKGRNGYFPPIEANYTVRVEQCKDKKASDNSGTAFIVELEVLESSTPEVEKGDFKDWYQATDGSNIRRKMAANDIATFLCAALGYDPDNGESRAQFEQNVKVKDAFRSAQDSNSLDGRVLKLRTYPKKMKKSDGEFTVHCWAPGDAPKAGEAIVSECGNYLWSGTEWVTK